MKRCTLTGEVIMWFINFLLRESHYDVYAINHPDRLVPIGYVWTLNKVSLDYGITQTELLPVVKNFNPFNASKGFQQGKEHTSKGQKWKFNHVA